MKTSKQLREQIGELLARAEALHAMATEEQRELEQEEQAEFDRLIAEVGHDGHDGEAKTGLYAKVEKAEKFEGILARNKAPQNRVPGIQTGPPRITEPARPKRWSAGTLKAFKGEGGDETAYRMGRWAAAALLNHEPSQAWCQENGLSIRNAQMETDNALGGFTVPSELESTIITLRENYGVGRRWASVEPMMSEVKHVPKYVSGLTAYAVGEAGTITVSDVDLERVELIARKWGALGRYSSEISEDSFVNWADRLADEMAYAFAQKEDESLFVGDGTSTYHGTVGVMNKVTSGVHVYTAASGNTAFSTLDLLDFENALGQLPQYAIERPGAAWFISRVGYYASMSRLANAAGGNNNDDLGAGAGMNFLGLPVVISQALNTTTDAQTDTNIFCVGNLGLGVTIGDRRGISMAVSNDVYFTTDEIGIRGTTRVAIAAHGLDAAAVGPIIIVRTPAS